MPTLQELEAEKKHLVSNHENLKEKSRLCTLTIDGLQSKLAEASRIQPNVDLRIVELETLLKKAQAEHEKITSEQEKFEKTLMTSFSKAGFIELLKMHKEKFATIKFIGELLSQKAELREAWLDAAAAEITLSQQLIEKRCEAVALSAQLAHNEIQQKNIMIQIKISRQQLKAIDEEEEQIEKDLQGMFPSLRSQLMTKNIEASATSQNIVTLLNRMSELGKERHALIPDDPRYARPDGAMGGYIEAPIWDKETDPTIILTEYARFYIEEFRNTYPVPTIATLLTPTPAPSASPVAPLLAGFGSPVFLAPSSSVTSIDDGSAADKQAEVHPL